MFRYFLIVIDIYFFLLDTLRGASGVVRSSISNSESDVSEHVQTSRNQGTGVEKDDVFQEPNQVSNNSHVISQDKATSSGHVRIFDHLSALQAVFIICIVYPCISKNNNNSNYNDDDSSHSNKNDNSDCYDDNSKDNNNGSNDSNNINT